MLRRLAPAQPATFEFTPANLAWAKGQITKYPAGRQASAVIPLLFRAQEQEGWLSKPAIEYVADMLEMPRIRALEVATFYFMFQLQPTGSIAHFQICGTTSCMICGAEDLVAVCKKKIASAPHTVSADGKFSWEEVECLGACANAPVAQIGKDYYEDLTAEQLEKLLDEMAAGKVPQPGSQIGRFSSEARNGPTALAPVGERESAYNASVTLARDIGDSIKRIDGTEVPLRTPWVDGPAPAVADAAPKTDPKPGAGHPIDETGVTVQEAPVKNEGAEPVTAGAPAETETATETEGARPAGLAAAREGGADDLKLIEGVGPKMEELLHELGFFHYDQIAAWSPAEVAWVDANLKGFKGRVTRDKWQAQAKLILEVGREEFLRRAKTNDY